MTGLGILSGSIALSRRGEAVLKGASLIPREDEAFGVKLEEYEVQPRKVDFSLSSPIFFNVSRTKVKEHSYA